MRKKRVVCIPSPQSRYLEEEGVAVRGADREDILPFGMFRNAVSYATIQYHHMFGSGII